MESPKLIKVKCIKENPCLIVGQTYEVAKEGAFYSLKNCRCGYGKGFFDSWVFEVVKDELQFPFKVTCIKSVSGLLTSGKVYEVTSESPNGAFWRVTDDLDRCEAGYLKENFEILREGKSTDITKEFVSQVPAVPEFAKSSSEMVQKLATPVQDFTGTIDGAGVKGVMSSPKCPLDLVTPQYLEGIAAVLLHGSKKYAPGNWMRGMSWETVVGGMQRHTQAIRRGEEIDPDSGLPHVLHVACGGMFLHWYMHGPQAEQHRKFDDRKFKEAA